jgi:DsbC/DsbD-like thiol-disulfide interchange protein
MRSYFHSGLAVGSGPVRVRSAGARGFVLFGLVLLALPVFGLLDAKAQAQDGADDPARADTVAWTLTAASPDASAPGSRVVLTLQGAVKDGWHVYGLKQATLGPTPLLVALDKNSVAAAAGAPTASKPITQRDPSFGLDTHFYTSAFTVSVPVHITAHAAAGPQVIPVSVRFQTCNGQICQPPKTVHLSASVTVRAAG